MRVRVGSDEFLWYYLSPEDDPFGGDVFVDLPARAYADYKRVQAEHEAWQKRLHALCEQQRMNG